MKFILALVMALTVCSVCIAKQVEVKKACDGNCSPVVKEVCGVKKEPYVFDKPYGVKTFKNKCIYSFETCKDLEANPGPPSTDAEMKKSWDILHPGACTPEELTYTAVTKFGAGK